MTSPASLSPRQQHSADLDVDNVDNVDPKSKPTIPKDPQSSWGLCETPKKGGDKPYHRWSASTFSDENHWIILQLQASPQWKTIGSWSPAGWEKEVFASWLSTHGSIQMFQRENMENHKNYKKVDALDPTELIFPTRMLIQLNLFLMFKTATMGQSSTDLHVTQNHQIWQTLWKAKMAENTIKTCCFVFTLQKWNICHFLDAFPFKPPFFWGFPTSTMIFPPDFQMPPASPKGRSMGTTSVGKLVCRWYYGQ